MHLDKYLLFEVIKSTIILRILKHACVIVFLFDNSNPMHNAKKRTVEQGVGKY